jgi:ATPase family protein associated with various cellular activities (AAA)
MKMKQNELRNIGLTKDIRYFADFVVAHRFAQALHEGVPRYAIFRLHRLAARVELEVLFDAIALDPAWRVERLHTDTLVIDGEGLYVAAYGTRKADYCSCSFHIWAADLARAAAVMERLQEKVGSTLITEPMFSIDWHFLTARGELESASIEEMADDVLHDRAYPEIPGGVRQFLGRYLESSETVLVLQGPPGTGKTRLIRAILGEMSRLKGEPIQALYTGDMRALQNDEVFVKFITGWHDAFVVEDADHLLKPRADGNEHLHRFLTIADGVVKAQGRKIVFSTNLPNVGDLDEALVRPGRCFAHINVRALTPAEARALVDQLAAGNSGQRERGVEALAASNARSHSLADVYRTLR